MIAVTNDGENLDLDAELSWNYEAGVRLSGSRKARAEFTYFRMDFSAAKPFTQASSRACG